MARYTRVSTLLSILLALPAWAGPGDILVKFRGGPPSELRQNAVMARRIPQLGVEVWEVRGDRFGLLEALRRSPAIEYAEEDAEVQLVGIPNDPRFGEMWGLNNTGQSGGVLDADIDAPEAWDITQGSEVVVGLVDTGLQIDHPDLAPNVWVNPGETAGNGIDDDGNGYIDDIHGWDFWYNSPDVRDTTGHGTHVGGTIAAVGNNGLGVIGVAPHAKIMVARGFNGSGFGTVSTLVGALLYTVDNGAKISNNSWVASTSSARIQTLYDAIAYAEQRGQLVVFAAANDGMDVDCARACPGVILPHPSFYPHQNLLTVAATTRTDAMAVFSNYGRESVDLGAPGFSVLSTYPTFKTATTPGYTSLSGTSMASPHVAGAAAVLKSLHPSWTHLELKAALMATVDQTPAMSGRTVSGGRLNLWRALSSAGPPASVQVRVR